MNGLVLNAVLAMAPQSSQQGQSQLPLWANLVPLLFLFVLFYFILIRPQQKKTKEHAQLLKAIKPGDKVLTSGGIIGIVVGIKEKSLSIRSADAKLEIAKHAVSEVLERSDSPSQS
jgi:preprotein translocase subunit YajC